MRGLRRRFQFLLGVEYEGCKNRCESVTLRRVTMAYATAKMLQFFTLSQRRRRVRDNGFSARARGHADAATNTTEIQQRNVSL